MLTGKRVKARQLDYLDNGDKQYLLSSQLQLLRSYMNMSINKNVISY